ncbi:MAG TPA: hypothetical protein VH276_00625 [Solirubrobacteraceae bacterium]|nr:hypothetical protein [Solirubrobacteraceae bacterium]
MKLRVSEHELGLSWVVEEPLQRASHALAADGRVWFIDPVADDAVLARAAELGEPAGVIRLLDRHGRDCDSLAASLGVPLYSLPDAIPDSPFEVVRLLHVPGWHEQALWWPERRALVVAEVVGSSSHYTLGGDRTAGIHPMVRLLPPGSLRRYQPEHLLLGHGDPLHGPEATTALHEAYARSRSDLPRMLLAAPALLGAAKGRWG